MQTKSILLAAAAAIVGVAGQAAAQQTIYGNGATLPAPFWRSALDCAGNNQPLVSRTGAAVAAATPVSPFVWDPDTNNDGIANNDAAPTSGFRAGTLTGTVLNCSAETSNQLTNFQGFYVSTGSGGGIQALLSHSPSFAGDHIPGNATIDLFPAGPHYALSEAGLGDNDVANYDLGTNPAVRPITNGLTLLAPGAVVPNPLPANTFPNPRERYGAMVQFPILIAPVTIGFDPVYRRYNSPTGLQEYRLRIQTPRTVVDANGNTITTGGIRLTPSAYCRIFHGQITDWNDNQLEFPAIAGNPSTFRDQADITQSNANFSAPIQIVGRSDGSGTTSIFTRHLATVCGAFVASNEYGTAGSTALPASRFSTAVWNRTTQTLSGAEVIGRFTRSAGNEGVADYVDFRNLPNVQVAPNGTQTPNPTLNDTGRGFIFNAGINAAEVLTQARIGYFGPDFVLPGVLATNNNAFGLTTADLLNGAGNFVAPTPTGARNAYESFLVTAGLDRRNPARWVAPLERFLPYDVNRDGAFDLADNPDTAAIGDGADRNPLGNPTGSAGNGFRGYPMVGTTNLLTYSCFSAGSARSALVRFLQEYFRGGNNTSFVNDINQGLLDVAGISALPTGWRTAINDVFLTNPDRVTGNPAATAILATANADGVGTVLNPVTGQQVPENSQCAGLLPNSATRPGDAPGA